MKHVLVISMNSMVFNQTEINIILPEQIGIELDERAVDFAVYHSDSESDLPLFQHLHTF